MLKWVMRGLVVLIMLASTSSCQTTEIVDPTIVPVPTRLSSITANEDRDACVVTFPPEEYRFDPFYKKYCNGGGIPIISSGEVDNRALQQAYYVITNLLAPIPEIKKELVDRGAYFAIMGTKEFQTTLPEYAHMDSTYWDQRARGLGADRWNPVTSGAEENLLCLRADRYYGESIAVHEFAHTIHLLGLSRVIRGFDASLVALYQSATERGLWHNTYAGTNYKEYWAEGVQSYFNTNLQALPTNGVHNHVNTREELAEYDPQLYQFIDEILGGFEWTPTCP